MADGDKLILGTDFNEENTTTELTKRVGFLPVLDLFNDNGVGLLSIGGQSIFHGNVVSKRRGGCRLLSWSWSICHR